MIPRPLNVATPPAAVAARVVLLVPTTFPEDSVAVTTFVADETLLFPASRISSTGCVVKSSLYTAPLALVVRMIWVGTPTPTEKLLEMAEPKSAVVNVSV